MTKALRAALTGLLFGLVLGGALFAFARFRYPSFLADSGDASSLVSSFVVAVGAAALLLGGLFGRFGVGLACGLAAALVAAGFALLLLPTPSAGKILLSALAAGGAATWMLARPLFQRGRGAQLLLAAGVVVLGAGALAKAPPAAPAVDPTRPKIFVFGLDAGTWTILNELFARGELPNLRRLRDEGTSGVLRSEVASFSPRVWTTLATGKLPEKHGILDFSCCQNEHLKTRRLWEILQSPGGGGWSVGLFQWLMTWPPDAFDPFIVPAWMARGPQTQPPELSFVKELEIAFQKGDVEAWLRDEHHEGLRQKAITSLRDWGRGYLDHGLRYSTLLKCVRKLGEASSVAATIDDPKAAAAAHDAIDYAAKRTIQLWINGDLYLDLYRRHQPDFGCLILYGTDNLAHKFWQYHFPDDFDLPRGRSAPLANLLTDYYKAADALLGEIVPLLPPQTTVAVVSDHGFTSGEGTGAAHQRELRPNVSALAELAGVGDEVSSTAVATHGFFTPKTADVESAMGLFDRLRSFIDGCATIEGGRKVFTMKVLASAQLQVDVNLDAELQLGTRIATPAGELPFQKLGSIEERAGNHSLDGIVILKGPHLRRGHPLEGARLQDLTPTLLYLEGKAVGGDMDGEVLYDAIDPDIVETSGRAERIESWDPLVPIQRDKSIVGDETAWRAYAANLGYVNGAPSGTSSSRGSK
jgi:predicted AlkP superfamily phosphohydrolase/phosphomutase